MIRISSVRTASNLKQLYFYFFIERTFCEFKRPKLTEVMATALDPEQMETARTSFAGLNLNPSAKADLKLWESIKDQCELVDFPDLDNCGGDQFRNRPLENSDQVFDQNAWDNIEWDSSMIEEATRKVANNSRVLVADDQKEMYENQASEFWNQFYGIHQNKFFKQRNWLLNEFPELQIPNTLGKDQSSLEVQQKRQHEQFPGEKSALRVLEVGCGNGSTVFPLLATNGSSELYVYCCDFSSSAVEVVKSNPELEHDRCTPFVWDATSCDLSTLPFPPGSLDVITLIFVLSAISPDKFDRVIQNLASLLRPGGLILFRDYGMYDLVQLRLKEGRCLSQNFYVRGDGTRVYFFSQEEVEQLFTKHGLQKEKLFVDRRLQVNRIKELKMYRIWIQGKFKKL